MNATSSGAYRNIDLAQFAANSPAGIRERKPEREQKEAREKQPSRSWRKSSRRP
jgi:hypothetical protein